MKINKFIFLLLVSNYTKKIANNQNHTHRIRKAEANWISTYLIIFLRSCHSQQTSNRAAIPYDHYGYEY